MYAFIFCPLFGHLPKWTLLISSRIQVCLLPISQGWGWEIWLGYTSVSQNSWKVAQAPLSLDRGNEVDDISESLYFSWLWRSKVTVSPSITIMIDCKWCTLFKVIWIKYTMNSPSFVAETDGQAAIFSSYYLHGNFDGLQSLSHEGGIAQSLRRKRLHSTNLINEFLACDEQGIINSIFFVRVMHLCHLV